MTDNFNDAVETVALLSRRYVLNGKIVLPRMEPETFVLQTKLGIRFDRFADDLEQTEYDEDHFHCSDEAAETLLEICEENAAAFDLCKRIAAHRLLVDRALPPALQRFAGRYLADLLTRPKGGGKRSITWLRNIYLLTLVRTVQKNFVPKPTRTRDGRNKCSACDAVSLGLAKNGHSVAYRAIEELCVGSKKEQKQLRNDFNDWVRAILAVLKSGEMSERQFAQTWLAPAVLTVPEIKFYLRNDP